jgi:predicted nucleic-acid-binding protein
MRAVDTNVLVRLLVRDDAAQAAAAEAFIAKGAWVSHLVLAETVWVLQGIFASDPEAVAEAVELLLNHEHLTVHEPDVVQGALLSFRTQPGVDFSDCLILAIARKAGHLPVGTFDRKLGRLEGATRLGAR